MADLCPPPPPTRAAILATLDPSRGRASLTGSPASATLKALYILVKSPKGYLLVDEGNAHTDDPHEGLQNGIDLDRPDCRS